MPNGIFNTNAANTAAVLATATGAGPGSNAVHATTTSPNDSAVYGEHTGTGIGVFGRGGIAGGEGVFGQVDNTTASGVYGKNQSAGNGGIGVSAESVNGIGLVSTGGILAGLFQGDIRVTGDVYLTGGDCAEQFDISAVGQSEPGTVMVISSSGKTLEPSCRPYDTKVAGVISGAGNCRPGIVLDKQISDAKRADIALIGRVYCKVDADAAPITVGDLLTTSDIQGHAMKAVDERRSFGAVIGKALQPLDTGRGLIPIMVALQ